MSTEERHDADVRGYMATAALKQKTERNTTHLFSHGYFVKDGTYLSMYDRRKKEGEKFSAKPGTKELRDLLKSDNVNTSFLDNKEGNIILHACFSGLGKNSVAEVISREYPGKLVVGATENVWYDKNGELGTWNKYTNERGKWNVYKNGKIIKSFKWNWKPNEKDLNKIKTK